MMKTLNKKQFIAGFALGFLAALIIAGIAVRIIKNHHRNPEKVKAHIIKKIQKGLDLDPAQSEKVTAIIDARFKEMHEVHETTRAKRKDLHNKARSEIRALLDDAQKVKFDEHIKKMDERRARWKQGHHM